MKTIIVFTPNEEIRAIPILLRHSPGSILSDGSYVVDATAAAELRELGIEFREMPPITAERGANK